VTEDVVVLGNVITSLLLEPTLALSAYGTRSLIRFVVSVVLGSTTELKKLLYNVLFWNYNHVWIVYLFLLTYNLIGDVFTCCCVNNFHHALADECTRSRIIPHCFMVDVITIQTLGDTRYNWLTTNR
jgi:hypothetical protein